MAAFARTAQLKPCTQRCVPPATAILVPQPDGHATSTTGHERAPRGASSAQRARRHRAVSHPRSPPRRRRPAKTGRRPGGGPDTATGDGMSLQARWQRQDGAAPARRVPAVQESGEGAALRFLAGDLPGEDVAVGVRGDGGEDQALQFDRFQRFHLPLHGAGGVEAVAAGEGRRCDRFEAIVRQTTRGLPEPATRRVAVPLRAERGGWTPLREANLITLWRPQRGCPQPGG